MDPVLKIAARDILVLPAHIYIRAVPAGHIASLVTGICRAGPKGARHAQMQIASQDALKFSFSLHHFRKLKLRH